MDVSLPLHVFKTQPIGWRTNLGGAHVGPLDAWNVEDASGRFLAGGLSEEGNNATSARAGFCRKCEAESYAAGYTAWVTGDLTVAHVQSSGLRIHAEALEERARHWARRDERIENAFQAGAFDAQSHRRRANTPLPPASLKEDRHRAEIHRTLGRRAKP